MRRTIHTTLAAVAAILAICAGGAVGGTIFYTTEAANSQGPSHLYSIDTMTHAITDRGEMHNQAYVTDLAMNGDGTMYGIGWTNGNANGASKLYQITPGDVSTWAQWSNETVHANKMDRTVNAAAFNNNDLYVASAEGDIQKLTYDSGHDRWNVSATAPLTGLITSGNGKCQTINYSSGGDMAFSADGGTLYVALTGGLLGKVNFDAGSSDFGRVTPIGQTGYSQICGLAVVDGQLYGTTNGDSGYTTSYLVKLDPQTGQASNAFLLNGYAWGATAMNANFNVPEPMTAGMVMLGGALIVIRRRRAGHAV